MSKKTFTVIVHILNNSNSFVGEPCYLTSNVSNWQVDAHPVGVIPPLGEKTSVLLEGLEESELEFKITRGAWDTLNSTANGELLAPYQVDASRDSEVQVTIDGWRDKFPPSTASPQVHVLADNFYFPYLDTYRKVWIYLPKDYPYSDKQYPVLYMHDGQHLFDEATSVGRSGPVEWMVDETIDAAGRQAIVIGIEHPAQTTDRAREFLLFPFEELKEPLGHLYLRDIVEVLKPYVDKHYRTLADKRYTGMVGSSFGGLLTLYAGALHADVFGTLGVFSPSIWTGKQQLADLFSSKLKSNPCLLCGQRYYFYVGGKEKRKNAPEGQGDMRADMLDFIDEHKKAMCVKIMIDIDEEGKHGALYWQKAFTRFYERWQQEISDN
ncbi:alpha/beta hydrolase [Sphingobacterium chuzhouense]|uniref:Alpha/beta hydrolase n=1 Tax=Sphingobacterium chuzhouense TaxID=1742264 RepID=A0ABR7XLD5_9SPHI|nr:alpha/beta hydrolase-fold protein [Sphingobacterium chuzhouense]MBD1419981.1 alpha/beta hydrolase [Sphingobacterium chuzhouense]